jgi:hypothetical protein
MTMPVTAEASAWRHDFDNALSDAGAQRLLLVDFSAAPT